MHFFSFLDFLDFEAFSFFSLIIPYGEKRYNYIINHTISSNVIGALATTIYPKKKKMSGEFPKLENFFLPETLSLPEIFVLKVSFFSEIVTVTINW